MDFRQRYSETRIPHFHAWHDRRLGIDCERRPIVGPSTRIATIGSCFAAELADAMDRLGLAGGMNPTGLVYNSRSLRQEILAALGEWHGHEQEPVWKVPGGYVSPFHHPKEVHPSEQSLADWTAGLRRRAAALFTTADVIVITLGLVECWVRPETGTAYRYLPHQDVFDSIGPAFHRLTVTEMLDDLGAIRDAIRRRTGAEIILTVSPVPLHATFTPLDIRVANTESKSRIRAAVSEFVAQNPDVHYFHSYEIVTTAERQSDFMLEDGRHVSRRGVDYILAEFMRTFAAEGALVPEIDSSWITPPAKTARRSARGPLGRIRAWADRMLEKSDRPARVGRSGPTVPADPPDPEPTPPRRGAAL